MTQSPQSPTRESHVEDTAAAANTPEPPQSPTRESHAENTAAVAAAAAPQSGKPYNPLTDWLVYVSVFAGGFVGTLLRYGLAAWLPQDGAKGGVVYWGTFTANMIAALLLGMVSAYWARATWTGPRTRECWNRALGVGLCGGLSTMSTFAVELVEQIATGQNDNTPGGAEFLTAQAQAAIIPSNLAFAIYLALTFTVGVIFAVWGAAMGNGLAEWHELDAADAAREAAGAGAGAGAGAPDSSLRDILTADTTENTPASASPAPASVPDTASSDGSGDSAAPVVTGEIGETNVSDVSDATGETSDAGASGETSDTGASSASDATGETSDTGASSVSDATGTAQTPDATDNESRRAQ